MSLLGSSRNADTADTTANSFATINCPAGTDPVATSAADTLNLTSADGSLSITGNSTTDTIDLAKINIAVKATLTASSTTKELAQGDYRVVDFDQATDDPFTMLTAGATCRVTIPAGGGGDYASQFQLTFNGTSIGFNAGDQIWCGFNLNGTNYVQSFSIHNIYANGSYNVSHGTMVVPFPNLSAGDFIIPICRPITTSRAVLTNTTFTSIWSFWKTGN